MFLSFTFAVSLSALLSQLGGRGAVSQSMNAPLVPVPLALPLKGLVGVGTGTEIPVSWALFFLLCPCPPSYSVLSPSTPPASAL